MAVGIKSRRAQRASSARRGRCAVNPRSQNGAQCTISPPVHGPAGRQRSCRGGSACSWESLLRPASCRSSRSNRSSGARADFRGRDPVGEVCASGHNSGVETLRAEHAADVEEMSGARISLLRSDRPGPLCSCARCGGERSQARKRHRSGQAARHASAAQLLACRTPAACLQAVHAKHAGTPVRKLPRQADTSKVDLRAC